MKFIFLAGLLLSCSSTTWVVKGKAPHYRNAMGADSFTVVDTGMRIECDETGFICDTFSAEKVKLFWE